ncbi:MAG TPA: four-helix bundle copper-binding protein [Ktedonosporobacter sp.]|nr:four-helix bundle copper-binding protein [Ktedonosporobacter sp.]
MQNTANPMLTDQMNDCIQDCLNCHTVCLDTAMRVMQKSGNADNVRTLLDCAEICLTSAHFMLRNSPLHTSTCQLCAMICQHCEEMCAQIGENDCANACNACANSCQQMAKMVA